MATFEELARAYADALASAPNSHAAALEIVRDLRSRYFPSTGQPLSQQHKWEILNNAYKDLANRPSYTKSMDNNHYLQLIEWILSQV